MSNEESTQINLIEAMTATKEDAKPKPMSICITIDVDGKTFEQNGMPIDPDGDTNARNLASLLSEVGSQAVYQLHGKDVSRAFGSYLVAMPPPTTERLQYEPLYRLLTGIVNEEIDATGWSWSICRLDDSVQLIKTDAATGTVVETIPGRAIGNAWMDCVRASYHGATDVLRAVAGQFASYGIPYRTVEASAEPIGGPLPHLPHGAALAQRAILKAAMPLLNDTARAKVERRCEALAAQAEADPLTDGNPDIAPKKAKALASELGLHPVRARKLATALRTSPDKVALLADALESYADNQRGSQEAINIVSPRPVWEDRFKDEPKDVAVSDARMAEIKEDYLCDLAEWREQYGKVGPKRSNNLARRAIAAMRFDWTGNRAAADKAYDAFEERFNGDSTEEVFRKAIRPWVGSKKLVQVGNTMFGKLGEQWHPDHKPLRRSDTPRDFYRLLYLTNPVGLSFTDMYSDGLFGVTSPCGRFAMAFYFHKYELAAYQYVTKELAVRTREERGPFSITCGVPGSDNGVATMDKDAARWFRMVDMALGREWCVYGGNDFVV